MSQMTRDFIERVGKTASADMITYRILASLKIAQAILESGWGRSVLATQANALYGIKADSRWNGRVFNTKTQEFSNGLNAANINASFRAYDSWEQSISDHSIFLTTNSRYAAVIGETDYIKACRAIHAAGYATNPEYSDKLIRLIEQHRLTDFDTVREEETQRINIIQDFIPVGRRNRPGRVNPMRFITIHNTGNASKGAGARSHANYIKSDAAANRPASWHYTVDERDIYQHLPDNEDAFHAGDGAGAGNRQSIGIEICMNSDGDLLGATDNAVRLTAHLCRKYNIPVENIVQHHWWSRKNCPQMIRNNKPYSWDTFLHKVQKEMGIASASLPASATSAPADTEARITAGSRVRLRQGAKTYTGGGISAWVFNDTWIVHQVSGNRVVLNNNVSGKNAIMTPVNIVDLVLV